MRSVQRGTVIGSLATLMLAAAVGCSSGSSGSGGVIAGTTVSGSSATSGGSTPGSGSAGGSSTTAATRRLPPGLAAFRVQVQLGSVLNVRSGPGTGNGMTGEAHLDEVYVGIQESGAWRRIWFDDQASWVHGDYLRPAPAGVEVKEVTASVLNVRRGAGTRFSIVGRLPRGALVAVQDRDGDWLKVSHGGQQAWVHGSYLSDPNPSAPPPTPPSQPTGSRGFIQISASGVGFYDYSPASDRWGTPTMVHGLERIGREWARLHPGGPRMGLGDLSLRDGGPIPGHVSHQHGVDVDVRPVRTSGEGPVTINQSAYSRTGTRELIDLFYANLPITLVLFNDAAVPRVQSWPNHHNHFHARMRR